MTYLLIYLGIGVLFWARCRFCLEMLQKRDWTQLRRQTPGEPYKEPIRHTQERQWVEWTVSSAFYVLLWPLCAALIVLIGLNVATEWLLGRLMG